MSFGAPSQPPPMIVPPAPPAAPQLTPTSQKPPRKPQQPSVVGTSFIPGQDQNVGRSLIGGG